MMQIETFQIKRGKSRLLDYGTFEVNSFSEKHKLALAALDEINMSQDPSVYAAALNSVEYLLLNDDEVERLFDRFIKLCSSDPPSEPFLLDSRFMGVKAIFTLPTILYGHREILRVTGCPKLILTPDCANADVILNFVAETAECIDLDVTEAPGNIVDFSSVSKKIRDLKMTNVKNTSVFSDLCHLERIFILDCKQIPSCIFASRATLDTLLIDGAEIGYFSFFEFKKLSVLELKNVSVEYTGAIDITLQQLRLINVTGLYGDFLSKTVCTGELFMSNCPIQDGILSNIAKHLTMLSLDNLKDLSSHMLDDFSELIELSIENVPRIVTIGPSAPKLKKLRIVGPSQLTDKNLKTATSLELLIVPDQLFITTVAPFAKTLTQLEASGRCSINDTGLVGADKLCLLNITNNQNVTNLAFCAKTIVTLNISGQCGVTENGLKPMPLLRELCISGNRKIRSMEFFKGVKEVIARDATLAKFYKRNGRGIKMFLGHLDYLDATNNDLLDLKLIEPYVTKLDS